MAAQRTEKYRPRKTGSIWKKHTRYFWVPHRWISGSSGNGTRLESGLGYKYSEDPLYYAGVGGQYGSPPRSEGRRRAVTRWPSARAMTADRLPSCAAAAWPLAPAPGYLSPMIFHIARTSQRSAAASRGTDRCCRCDHRQLRSARGCRA